MNRRIVGVLLAGVVAMSSAPVNAAAQAPASVPAAIAYPQARTVDVTETHFGTPVADPYRWLENDVRTDPQVKAWVDAEKMVTDSFLQTLPLRDWFNSA